MCRQSWVLSGGSRGSLSPGVSSFYRLPLFLGLWLPSIFKASGVASSHLTLILLPPTFTFKGPCDYNESTWIIQEKSPHLKTLNESKLQSPFYHEGNIFRDPRIMMWTSLGAIILSTTMPRRLSSFS